MKEKFKIAILGIGGVGGYFGGKLAAHFTDSEDVEIIFIARGENEKGIKTNGLKVVTTQEEFVAKPHLVTNDANEIGQVDLFLICTKAYGLEESINKFKSCITEKTAVLPLLNGVDNSEIIKEMLPDSEIWKGCAFIVARLVSPGIIKVNSDIKLLQFGSVTDSQENLEKVAELFKSAGIDSELSKDIEKTIWEKFIFISSLATLTSFLNKNVGEILNSSENLKTLVDLISEVTRLAQIKKVNVAENIEELTLEKIRKAPQTATSSMHSDFMKGGETELETLTGYVVREAKSLNLSTPVYDRIYQRLKNRD